MRDVLSAQAVRRELQPRDVVVPAATAATGLFCVLDGTLAVTLRSEGAPPRLIDLCGMGFWCGRTGSVRATSLAVEVVARRRTTVAHLPAGRVEALFEADAASASALTALVAAQGEAWTRLLDIAATPDVPRRVARRLLAWSDGTRRPQITIIQQELADMVAASRNAVNRVLRDLERAGMVDVAYGRVALVDVEALRRVAAAPEAAAMAVPAATASFPPASNDADLQLAG